MLEEKLSSLYVFVFQLATLPNEFLELVVSATVQVLPINT